MAKTKRQKRKYRGGATFNTPYQPPPFEPNVIPEGRIMPIDAARGLTPPVSARILGGKGRKSKRRNRNNKKTRKYRGGNGGASFLLNPADYNPMKNGPSLEYQNTKNSLI